MSDEIYKMRTHNITFSEEEFHELMRILENNIHVEKETPLWKMLNRMSYSMAHGTEEGWSDV